MEVQMIGSETRRIGSEILSDIDEINMYIRQLYSVIEKVSNSWQSESATNYITIMKEKNIPELEKLCDILKKYGTFMNNIPTAYETLDEIFSSKGIDF